MIRNGRPTTNCIIRDALRARQSESSGLDPNGFEAVESMRRLMALGMTVGEIEELDLDRQTLQAICEYARLEDDRRGSSAVVEATLGMLEQEMQSCEIEQEMLKMRRRALSRRERLLRKLAGRLGRG